MTSRRQSKFGASKKIFPYTPKRPWKDLTDEERALIRKEIDLRKAQKERLSVALQQGKVLKAVT
jgi:hypothetical protein